MPILNMALSGVYRHVNRLTMRPAIGSEGCPYLSPNNKLMILNKLLDRQGWSGAAKRIKLPSLFTCVRLELSERDALFSVYVTLSAAPAGSICLVCKDIAEAALRRQYPVRQTQSIARRKVLPPSCWKARWLSEAAPAFA